MPDRHLRELAVMVARGDDATLVFVVQRTDCDRFRPAADLDPAFAVARAQAEAAGVRVLVCGCAVTPQEVALDRRLSRG